MKYKELIWIKYYLLSDVILQVHGFKYFQKQMSHDGFILCVCFLYNKLMTVPEQLLNLSAFQAA